MEGDPKTMSVAFLVRRKKGFKPTLTGLFPRFLQPSFSSGRFNNGQPELMVSHSSGALGISTPALTRSVRPDSLVSMVSLGLGF
jgi:hypothetical protein